MIKPIKLAKKNFLSSLDMSVEEIIYSLELANKFKKHDLLGIPFQIIIGSKSQDDEFEFKEIDGKSKMLNSNNITKELKKYFV